MKTKPLFIHPAVFIVMLMFASAATALSGRIHKQSLVSFSAEETNGLNISIPEKGSPISGQPDKNAGDKQFRNQDIELIAGHSRQNGDIDNGLQSFGHKQSVKRYAEVLLNKAVRSPYHLTKGDSIKLNLFEDAQYAFGPTPGE